MSARVSIRKLPNAPQKCSYALCVYNGREWSREGEMFGLCPSPRYCKPNSDALCHRMNNKDMLAMFRSIPIIEGKLSAPPTVAATTGG